MVESNSDKSEEFEKETSEEEEELEDERPVKRGRPAANATKLVATTAKQPGLPVAKAKKSSFGNEKTRFQVQCRPAIGKSFTIKWAASGGEENAVAKARQWLEEERAAGR